MQNASVLVKGSTRGSPGRVPPRGAGGRDTHGMRRSWWLPGLALALIGGAMFLTGGADPGSVGPFTYDHPMTGTDRSLSRDVPLPSLITLSVTRAQLTGAAVVIVGLMALAAGAGFRWGRRRPAR